MHITRVEPDNIGSDFSSFRGRSIPGAGPRRHQLQGAAARAEGWPARQGRRQTLSHQVGN